MGVPPCLGRAGAAIMRKTLRAPPPAPPRPAGPPGAARCRWPGPPTCAQQRGQGEEQPQEAPAGHVAAGLRVCRGHGRLPPSGRGGRTAPPPAPARLRFRPAPAGWGRARQAAELRRRPRLERAAAPGGSLSSATGGCRAWRLRALPVSCRRGILLQGVWSGCRWAQSCTYSLKRGESALQMAMRRCAGILCGALGCCCLDGMRCSGGRSEEGPVGRTLGNCWSCACRWAGSPETVGAVRVGGQDPRELWEPCVSDSGGCWNRVCRRGGSSGAEMGRWCPAWVLCPAPAIGLRGSVGEAATAISFFNAKYLMRRLRSHRNVGWKRPLEVSSPNAPSERDPRAAGHTSQGFGS